MQFLLLTFPILFCTSCEVQSAESRSGLDSDACITVESGLAMSSAVRETSGIVLSGDGSFLWTHNDRGNAPVLYGIGPEGDVTIPAVVTGALLEDWEDIAAGPCGAGRCLYIGDIGDNDGSRAGITIYEVEEPTAGAESTVQARAIHLRYPDGPHNAEALFMLPGGDLYIATKGDAGPIALYRHSSAARSAGHTTLERVREILPRPDGRRELVTGADASPDGEWVVIRTYGALHFYRATELVGGAAAEPVTVDLRPLGEVQGEGVAFGAEGTIWLTSEAGNRGESPRRAQLKCQPGRN